MLFAEGLVSPRSEPTLTIALAPQWGPIQTVLSGLLLVFMEGPGKNTEMV